VSGAIDLYGALIPRFGKPGYLFAPNPSPKIADSAGNFYYVRPLATIEPMAIRLGLPVNTHYGYADTTSLVNALTGSGYASSTVFRHRDVQRGLRGAEQQGHDVPPVINLLSTSKRQLST
jgi:hypothetical protein